MAKATREAYGEEISRLIQQNPKIVVLDADLAGSTHSAEAKKVCPERFFDMGIAEANMIGVSAGLAASGYIPFASSFAMFCTGRVWEQIRNSVAYPHLNIKIVGSHSGITVGEDGVTHQAIEDIAIMRDITGLEVYAPCDQWETKAVIDYVASTTNPCYVRLGRSKVEDVFDENKKFDVTKINVLRKGTSKVVLFATGLMVQSSLAARDILKDAGYDVTVVDVCAIKPVDEDGIARLLAENDDIFTVEEHSVTGGLGSLICEVACDTVPKKIHRIGMRGFGQSADWKTLLHNYKLDGEGVASQVLEVLNNK
ncbi:MAG: transketolase C-terminal domain-containing protein [Erysipelotrichaceae bacterium]|jgi:transketolase|nr:transketolase C-terminal domain-containing protein [Erysipelotrichaceae bacterium]